MANKVAIVTDSTACIPREQIEKYAIELVPIELIFGDKVYRDGIDISPTEFYALLRHAKELCLFKLPLENDLTFNNCKIFHTT